MAYRGQGQKVQKVMVQPIVSYAECQDREVRARKRGGKADGGLGGARSRIQVWLYEQVNMRIEGCIIGFDEYMNLVLDDAEEIHSKTKSRKQLERVEGREERDVRGNQLVAPFGPGIEPAIEVCAIGQN
ncbi:Small nuclear ribonucleoprotein E [Myotis davidii]|uniref:Small nuclear ribonucleoprotein E n=1 Tax=Myotis davidii TaxID=225400 RepID=L5LEH2_MYODS|nr:Small nuclear ribonucleoprotein E [Myotis davidii]